MNERKSWKEWVQDPRRARGCNVRREVERLIRDFFEGEGFVETPTPQLVRSPGMEPHIRPMRVMPHGHLATAAMATAESTEPVFLQTSPEFAMKKLLAGGLERIFQLAPVFRAEPFSTTHHPEFLMLEWYRAHAGYEDIMEDTERLFEFVARKLFDEAALTFQGRRISVAAPWPRLRVRDLFEEHVGIDLVRASSREVLGSECRRLGLSADASDTWDDLYFKIWLNLIEPRLPADRAVFVVDYPASQVALAVVGEDPKDGSRWARRFELYAGGIELGNAFEELTDPAEQRRRFEADMRLREEIYGRENFPANPIDEDFIRALEEGMPSSGGIAVGVDRMVMLFADEPDIGYTRWLPSFWPYY